MDRDALRAAVTQLNGIRSRRQVLSAVGRGAVGGVGAALISRGIGNGLLDARPARAAWAGGAMVDIVSFAYKPKRLEVPVGTDVTWTNRDYPAHTVTADDRVTFDSGVLNTGQTFRHTFNTVGTFDYHCDIHPDMRGKVVVIDAPVYPAPTTTPPETYVRRNVHNLDPAGPELTAYANAVEAMQALPNIDPLSWAYQANMHATWLNPPPPEPAPTSELPGWTTCEHGSLFFWPWHRMYLYWFERIIREMSGDPTFALPYWDYSDPAQRVLPAPFRDPASPLFAAERDLDVNNGSAPGVNVPESIFDHCAGLAESVFDFASFNLESTPHGGVHVWVAGAFGSPPTFGWMAAFDTAARDPIFWLHHANIDRLWESWLALGNPNSSDPAWLANDVNSGNGRPYDFFDEAGTQVTTVRIVNEVLDAAALGYEYEGLSDLSTCPGFMTVAPAGDPVSGTPTATPDGPLELGDSTPAEGIEVGPAPVSVPVTLDQAEAAAAIASAGGPTVLTLDGVQGTGVPAVTVEVYINLPPGQEPDFRSPYYVGNLNLFGLLDPDEAHQSMQSMTQRFNIARNVIALAENGEWTGDFEVTLVPYFMAPTATPEGVEATLADEPPPGPWVTVESVSVSAG